MKKLLAALFVVFFLSACGSEPAVVVPVEPTPELTVVSIVVPTEVPLPVKVGERGKLSLMQPEVQVVQGDCSPDVVELTAFVDDLKFNFLPITSSNPLDAISVCKDGLSYGAGRGSGNFGIYVPLSMAPGVYEISLVVEIGIDYHPTEILSLPITVVVVAKE